MEHLVGAAEGDGEGVEVGRVQAPAARAEAGTATKKSSRATSPCGERTIRKPPAPGPVSGLSATAAANAAAHTASTAPPPRARASAPARALSR